MMNSFDTVRLCLKVTIYDNVRLSSPQATVTVQTGNLFGVRVMELILWLELPNGRAMNFRRLIRDAEFSNYLNCLK